MTKLILVRHALTTDNQDKKLSGHIDSKVSELGKKQIKQLTNYLENIDIDKIYTTTSSRTKDTVKNVANKKKIKIIEKEALKEISFGDFEGITFDDIKNNYPEEFNSMIKNGYKYKYPNGESLIDSFIRVSQEIDNILEMDKNKTILICSHGGTIRNIVSYLVCKNYENHWNFKIDNASVTILEIEDGFSVIDTLNNKSFIKN